MANIERFFSKVHKTDSCWIWTGTILRKGRAQFWDGNKRVYAARFSYEIHKGKIIDGMLICHTCDNPSCVNPKHLFQGTAKENANDRDKKGRFKKLIGEQNGFSKLSSEIIPLIRRMPTSKAAKKYNVCLSTIKNIKSGKTWRHVIS